MPKFTQERLLPYSAQQMFDLVADVQSYPDFLPWCCGVQLISEEKNTQDIDLTIGYKAFTDTFRSRVHLFPASEIKVDYLGGAMKNLKTQWLFQPINDHNCKINFFIDFSFGSGFLQFAIERIFSQAVSQIIEAFEKRAQELYKS